MLFGWKINSDNFQQCINWSPNAQIHYLRKKHTIIFHNRFVIQNPLARNNQRGKQLLPANPHIDSH